MYLKTNELMNYIDMRSLFVFVFSFILGVQGKGVILSPKESHMYSFNYHSFIKEHNVNHLATFGDFVLYKTNMNNYNKYKNTFNHLFDVEEEQVYKVSPIVHNHENHNVMFIQEPGKSEFKIQEPVPWHLDRISKRHLPLDGTYPYSEQGSCHKNSEVDIETVVVDTGCDVSHPEFEGRAEFLENFTDDGQNYDGNNHGTHCSGIIASKTYGVCKDAKIKCVKVLAADGSGSTSGVIAGMEYTFKRHLKKEKENPNFRTIMSMSLGGGYSFFMNRAVEKMVKSSDTFYIVVAAGNENSNSCRSSPASAKGIFTVMAMGMDDQRAYFSNHGKCASIYGTGVEVKSTIPGGKTAVYSGTSFSCPTIVGILNHYLDQFPHLNMKEIKEKMLEDATKDTIKGNPQNTPNLMSYLHRED